MINKIKALCRREMARLLRHRGLRHGCWRPTDFENAVPGVISIKANVSSAEYERIAREWREKYSSTRQTVTIKGMRDDG